MSSPGPAASQQAVVEAALVLLERMGLSPADLVAAPATRPAVPTFAEYLPVVSATVSPGTRRAYGSYWNRVVEHWGGRRLDEPTPSEVRQLMAWVKTHVVARRNARGDPGAWAGTWPRGGMPRDPGASAARFRAAPAAGTGQERRVGADAAGRPRTPGRRTGAAAGRRPAAAPGS